MLILLWRRTINQSSVFTTNKQAILTLRVLILAGLAKIINLLNLAGFLMLVGIYFGESQEKTRKI